MGRKKKDLTLISYFYSCSQVSLPLYEIQICLSFKAQSTCFNKLDTIEEFGIYFQSCLLE